MKKILYLVTLSLLIISCSGGNSEVNVDEVVKSKDLNKIKSSREIVHKEYEKLVADLKAEFAMIFKKCTMTGEAHEQLHNYLIPLKTKIESLSEPINDEKTIDLSKYLKDYFNYFQ